MRKELERLRKELKKLKEGKETSFFIVKEDDGVYYFEDEDKKVILNESELEGLKKKYTHIFIIKKV